MPIKYSLLMPYIKRDIQLRSTFDSFVHHYSERNDFEVVIIEDLKNKEDAIEHEKLINLVNVYCRFFPIYIIDSTKRDCYNPSILYNLGAARAKGEFLIITNPECMHEVNILNGLDEEFKKDFDVYVMCSCKSVKVPATSISKVNDLSYTWFQHLHYRNVELHFCSAISKENYIDIAGFDYKYADGYCFEDDDFRNKIKQAAIEIRHRDDLVVIHLAHSKTKVPDRVIRFQKNENLFISKWGRKAPRADLFPIK
jgi:hypothetical protein